MIQSLCDSAPHKEKLVFDCPFLWIVELPHAYIFVQWKNSYLAWSSIYSEVEAKLIFFISRLNMTDL